MRSKILVVMVGVALLCVGCTTAGAPTGVTTPPATTAATSTAGGAANKGPITVGSKIDTEGSLLGQIIIAMLKANGFQTVDKTQTGPTDIVRKALGAGSIDVYPEYTGTALTTFFPTAKIPPAVLKNAAESWATAARLDKQYNDVTWLKPAPANNTWAIAVPQVLAAKNKLVTLADFAKYVNSGGAVKLVGSSEFVQRADALPAFEKAYGFTLSKSQLIILSGGNTAQTEKAAAQGTSGANAAMAYGTDGSLAALKLVVLTDPKGVQPIYNPAPIFAGSVLAKYPEVRGILDPVFATLDGPTLQGLNAQIALEGKSAADVAKAYLTQKGFLK